MSLVETMLMSSHDKRSQPNWCYPKAPILTLTMKIVCLDKPMLEVLGKIQHLPPEVMNRFGDISILALLF